MGGNEKEVNEVFFLYSVSQKCSYKLLGELDNI